MPDWARASLAPTMKEMTDGSEHERGKKTPDGACVV
jgi:hypothetical protein